MPPVVLRLSCQAITRIRGMGCGGRLALIALLERRMSQLGRDSEIRVIICDLIWEVNFPAGVWAGD